MSFTPYDRLALSSIALLAILIGISGGVQAQNTPAATFTPNTPATGLANASAADGFSQQNKQLTSTFTDPRTGQIYGRYIIYESVPVVKYQQKQVTEKQWVPEWVVEPKQTTQTTYTPVVSYQLQLQTERTLNPFVAPRQYWQYVPVVQYQPNHTSVMQQVTYQKYVEKEFTKVIPELVASTQQVPRYADLPLQNQPNLATAPLTTPTAQTTGVPSTPMAQVALPAPPPAYYVASNAGGASNTVANNGVAGGAVGTQPITGSPAYTPSIGGWNQANPMVSRQYAGSYPAAPQYVNNPYPNAGLPNQYVAAMPQSQPFQWPQFMNRTGSIFQGGLLRNNSTVSSPYGGTPYAGTSYIATNPNFNYQSSQVLPGLNTNTNGVSFTPNGYPVNGAVSNGYWNVAPVNNYRDPTQTGIPASVLR